MELTDSGFYKTPRIIKGVDFIQHCKDTLDCGNLMYVKFGTNEEPARVFDCIHAHNTGFDYSVYFTTGDRPRGDALIEDISQFEFIQYRPQTAWVAIHMGNTKRINLEQFDEIFISDTFRHLKPVIVLHQEKFWHVMGLELNSYDGESCWYIYLKRQDSDFMTRIRMPLTQKFIFNPLSNSWSLDAPTEEITDLQQIKVRLKGEPIREVVVSGVSMRLVRVQEIAKGVLFFVFNDEKDNRRYYYNRPAIKLRIVTNPDTLEKEYLLDHVKAMHID